MYPSRYYDLFNAGMSYAAKFDLLLCLGRRLKKFRERMEKLREANRRLQ
jgi:hypothetical protein